MILAPPVLIVFVLKETVWHRIFAWPCFCSTCIAMISLFDHIKTHHIRFDTIFTKIQSIKAFWHYDRHDSNLNDTQKWPILSHISSFGFRTKHVCTWTCFQWKIASIVITRQNYIVRIQWGVVKQYVLFAPAGLAGPMILFFVARVCQTLWFIVSFGREAYKQLNKLFTFDAYHTYKSTIH